MEFYKTKWRGRRQRFWASHGISGTETKFFGGRGFLQNEMGQPVGELYKTKGWGRFESLQRRGFLQNEMASRSGTALQNEMAGAARDLRDEKTKPFWAGGLFTKRNGQACPGPFYKTIPWRKYSDVKERGPLDTHALLRMDMPAPETSVAPARASRVVSHWNCGVKFTDSLFPRNLVL